MDKFKKDYQKLKQKVQKYRKDDEIGGPPLRIRSSFYRQRILIFQSNGFFVTTPFYSYLFNIVLLYIINIYFHSILFLCNRFFLVIFSFFFKLHRI